ncbi:hypothetical protein [Nonomuraea sp. bgisy101]|uniref:hypothetical protein n=1 Tax=Nonomuraea sp. bgisy101 TaxID=3413784 RepID=UPI003D74C5EA
MHVNERLPWTDSESFADPRPARTFSNMAPYGEIQLRTDRRLELTSLPGEAGLDQQPNGQRL